MAFRGIRVNTFFQKKQKPFIDFLSKLYIVGAFLLGLNRLPVILNESKYLITFIAVAYTVIFTTLLNYTMYIYNNFRYIVVVMSVSEYMFGIIFSFVTWKRLERYYNELNVFDAEIGCRPKVTDQSIKNFIFMVCFNVLFSISFVVAYFSVLAFESGYRNRFLEIPTYLLHCLELYFYGHLLSLIVPRLRLLNYFVEIALSNGKAVKCPKIQEFRSFKSKNDRNTDMKTLMDLYHIIIKGYGFLIEAIKWQLLVILVTTFITSLIFCYYLAQELINNELSIIGLLSELHLMAMEMLPLFSPCMFGDRVHGEVRRLRELLASRLYENRLDKSGRGAARALLALTEARDLSFSLLRMLQIDISLPFKFIGLLVTYLIIMLQFEKVINPPTSTNLPPTI